MQRGKRSKFVEPCEHGVIDDYGLAIVGAAVDHAMTYCRRKLSQACSKERYELIECLRHAHYVRPSPSLLDLLSLWSLRDQPRVHAYALDLSFEQSLKLIASSHGKKLKLDARAAGIDDENRVRHGFSP